MTPHCQSIITTYKSGLSLREVAQAYKISWQRVHYVITEYAPDALREPHRVPQRCRWPRVDTRVNGQDKQTLTNLVP